MNPLPPLESQGGYSEIRLIKLQGNLKTTYDNYLELVKNEFKRQIFLIDLQIESDSTELYVISATRHREALLEKIPTLYAVNDSVICFIFEGSEKPLNWNPRCINEILEKSREYSDDEIKVISWDKYIFHINYMLGYEPPILKFVFKNQKLISKSFVPTFIYKNNLHPTYVKY